MPAQVLRFPDFIGALPTKPGGVINPHFKDVDNDFQTWSKRTFGSRYAKIITWSDTPLLCAVTTPLASRHVLYAYIIYILTIMILDDITDDVSSSKATSITQAWIMSLRDSEENNGSNHFFIEKMRRDIVPAVKAIIGPFHWPQLIAVSEEFASHIVHEALAREAYTRKIVVYDIQSYLKLRRESGGCRLGFVFMRSSRDLRIPTKILSHPIVQEMENCGLDLVTLTNDVYSFKKEYEQEGLPSNILMVMQNDPKTTHLANLQDRIDYTMGLFVATLDRFQECRDQLSSFEPDLKWQLESLADGLLDWAAGNVEWSRLCRRYHVFANESDMKNNILRLGTSHAQSSITVD